MLLFFFHLSFRCLSGVGGAICGSFVVFGVLSVFIYKPWRRRIDARRRTRSTPPLLAEDTVDASLNSHAGKAPLQLPPKDADTAAHCALQPQDAETGMASRQPAPPVNSP